LEYILFSGVHSKQCIDIFLDNHIPVLGLLDDNRSEGIFYRGTHILGKLADLPLKCSSKALFFCACGNN